ncbi:transient receptor potential channel pyrexia isoform X3 [Balamuthia mandrillaris]
MKLSTNKKKKGKLKAEEAKSVDAKTGEGALHKACSVAEPDVEHIKELVRLGADPLGKDRDEWTPLHYLCKNCSFLKPMDAISIMHFFVEKGADPQARTRDQTTPLHYFAQHAPSHDPGEISRFALFLNALLERGADINAVNKSLETPLHKAAMYGSLAMVLLLLGKGADLTPHTKRGMTVLHYAVMSLKLPIVQHLITLGMDPTEVKGSCGSALDAARQYKGSTDGEKMVSILTGQTKPFQKVASVSGAPTREQHHRAPLLRARTLETFPNSSSGASSHNNINTKEQDEESEEEQTERRTRSPTVRRLEEGANLNDLVDDLFSEYDAPSST